MLHEFDLPGNIHLDAQWQAPMLKVRLNGQLALQVQISVNEGIHCHATLITLFIQDTMQQRWALLAALHSVFMMETQLSKFYLQCTDYPHALSAWLQSGLVMSDTDGQFFCTRESLVQQPDLWLVGACHGTYPHSFLISNGKRHPRRPPQRYGVVYRRFIPWLGQWLTLRTLEAEPDLESIHHWMNTPRVAKFWGEEGDLKHHQAFIDKVLTDPHVHPLIACLDEQAFGYFEVYWAKEDRIAPFYAVGDYDRGIHMLVGESWARGPQRVAAWLPSLVHYIMLDDPRTQVVVCEPRADNARMISYLQHYDFAYLRQFDFPHKRAALMLLEREVWAQADWFNPPIAATELHQTVD
ncbi:GNAT family N-acetyltransferase [Legionella cincinnatiensis]|uniref:N(6)-hydroxylysine O-acetyltransferase n=1 Tax=Legionella cincinnatiensis TaxID=28085 RepID=A0A378IND6_9GAMM|nr:GNAT family N-acetyltransferase [Legionella cincinnatiensis]KTC89265.1 N(6)-hydroxylysine O-acetyltransferase [Legionella cincinnatiensis]STX36312.1 N(6)-hydroxylysine O-acetyltransferase [Legionella cincinnatiensis]